MLRCLFWNQGRRALPHVAEAAAAALRLDIFAVCETASTYRATLDALNRVAAFHFTTGRVGDRFHIFTRFPSRYIGVRREAERFLILDVNLPARDPFFLMLLHGPSKSAGWTPAAMALEMSYYAASLRDAQAEHDQSRAVVVGDFNMNPFEAGMVGATAFNAVMDARQARQGVRTVQERQYSYFYNPMWSLMGDLTPGPPATLFYDAHTQEELQWHMLDQVIVSPTMIEYLNLPSIRVVDTIGDHRLVTKQGRPRKSAYSDHLPLYFELLL